MTLWRGKYRLIFVRLFNWFSALNFKFLYRSRSDVPLDLHLIKILFDFWRLESGLVSVGSLPIWAFVSGIEIRFVLVQVSIVHFNYIFAI